MSTRTHAAPARHTEDLAATFFGGCAEGKLLLQECEPHGHLQYPPGPICRRCAGPIARWVESGLEGRVESFSLVHRAPVPAFDACVPYMVGIVKLAEGPLVETWLRRDGRTPADAEVSIGQAVRFGFDTINGRVVPVGMLD